MKQYLDLMADVYANGKQRDDRTGTGTRSVFGRQVRYDLRKGFPLVTTKAIHWPSVVHELLWFISGDTNVKYLQENGVRIWDEWADEYGDLGPVYGRQWRDFGGNSDYGVRVGVDQLANVIEQIKSNPNSRRHIVSAWNPVDVDEMALPPCHTMFQFYVDDGELSCQLYQRSADIFLGVPFNIASYALLTHMIAHVCGLKVGEFIHTFGDLHLYNNHVEQAELQMGRVEFGLPSIKLNENVTSIFDFKFDDIGLIGYDHWPAIKAKVSV
mgnify:CR=1 FL=1